MGDRASVVIEGPRETRVCLYTHWAGTELPLTLQIDPGNPAEMNVEQQAIGVAGGHVLEKRFRRRERSHAEAVGRQKPAEALQHARIVVDDNYGAHAIADPCEPAEMFFG